MYLRKVIYQMRVWLKSIIPVFHKKQVENLIWLVVDRVRQECEFAKNRDQNAVADSN